ncbi:MAG: glutamate-1-semialdehyde 2,1-aminomutase [Bdellovibrionales bacterium]|nr:glutamate-1-semialdehyde 2,1-aminomutase [Bdellovibrionales bacterium]
MSDSRSATLFERAQRVIPGGVNSPVRAFKSVGGIPPFLVRGEGPYVFDVDGRQFIDYVGSWGPLILGHAAPLTREAILERLAEGVSFGAPTELEVEFAELLSEVVPGVEMVRMVSSGTEATMSAIRLARGVTGRDRIIKFNGCYHGHADSFLVQAGSGVATCGIAGSPGVPQAVAELTVSIKFNDLEMLKATVGELGPASIAAVIVEPVPGNMGLVLPEPGFLEGLRETCTQHGIVLIFDEVMSGFRVALGGAQQRFGVEPDLSTFGKVIGGGLPVGAFGGKRAIMSHLAPSGSVYQAGTLSGNPLSMAAGLAMVRTLRDRNPYPLLEARAEQWVSGMKSVAAAAKVPLSASSCGSMIGFFFSDSAVRSFEDAQNSDVARFKQFFHLMLEEGIYLAPSAFEAGFLSTEHTPSIIDQTISAASRCFAKLR